VERAPEKVEGGDFVGEEFDGEERYAGGDHGPGLEELESWREREVSEAGEEAEGGDGGIDVEAGSEGDRGEKREEFGERDLEPVGQDEVPEGLKAFIIGHESQRWKACPARSRRALRRPTAVCGRSMG
jgi:hypothetical protein